MRLSQVPEISNRKENSFASFLTNIFVIFVVHISISSNISNILTEFKYLGYKLSKEEKSMDIKFRMAMAEGKFQQMKKIFCGREKSIKLRT